MNSAIWSFGVLIDNLPKEVAIKLGLYEHEPSQDDEGEQPESTGTLPRDAKRPREVAPVEIIMAQKEKQDRRSVMDVLKVC